MAELQDVLGLAVDSLLRLAGQSVHYSPPGSADSEVYQAVVSDEIKRREDDERAGDVLETRIQVQIPRERLPEPSLKATVTIGPSVYTVVEIRDRESALPMLLCERNAVHARSRHRRGD